MAAIPVDLGDAVVLGLEDRVLEGTVAFGHRGGTPFAAWIRPDGRVTEAAGLPSVGAVTSMCTAEGMSAVVGESRPAVVYGDFAGRPDAIDGPPFVTQSMYAISEMANRLWVLCGDEDEFQLVLTGNGRLLAAECEIDSLNTDSPALTLVGDEQDLVVGADDGWVYVAGDVRSDSGATAPVWRAGTDGGGWHPVALDDPPDRVTDLHSSTRALSAGVRSGLASVHELRSGHSRTLPEIDVDPAWPRVFAGYEVVAVQTPRGPRVWLHDAEHVLPDGRLTAARDDGSRRCAWAVIDGTLHRVG